MSANTHEELELTVEGTSVLVHLDVCIAEHLQPWLCEGPWQRVLETARGNRIGETGAWPPTRIYMQLAEDGSTWTSDYYVDRDDGTWYWPVVEGTRRARGPITLLAMVTP